MLFHKVSFRTSFEGREKKSSVELQKGENSRGAQQRSRQLKNKIKQKNQGHPVSHAHPLVPFIHAPEHFLHYFPTQSVKKAPKQSEILYFSLFILHHHHYQQIVFMIRKLKQLYMRLYLLNVFPS